MTEIEWLQETDTDAMLEFLKDRVSHRKLRLFACACCRTVWPLLTNEDSRRGVEVAELFADGAATKEQLNDAHVAADKAVFSRRSDEAEGRAGHCAARAADSATEESAWIAAEARWHAWEAAQVLSKARARRRWRQQRKRVQTPKRKHVTASDVEQPKSWAHHAELLRDIVGNPFRPVFAHPAWLERNCGTVVQLAQSIYDDRRFGLLPMLADALEESGCDNADILDHCRGLGPHVRGCWVVDLLLGKN